MADVTERDLGPQPLAAIIGEAEFEAARPCRRLNAAAYTQNGLACRKGRRLTINTQTKVLNALNLPLAKNYSLKRFV